ncbi:actin-associated protein FAM107A-like [Plectropomus leopardus]|uniref:actin-associated protein FAM107A-like n=1 Tax=Plectropomus leopardus TaxID=160734 RepID=UPI001C4C61F0|nr:actin-associated protein FAM107A-like [Plectropomus leopardus]
MWTLPYQRGLVLSSRSELQQVLERRKRVQSDKEEEGQSRTPLDDVLLRRQQRQLEKEKEKEERVREEAHLMEFVRVRQNLRKIHTVIQSKAANT